MSNARAHQRFQGNQSESSGFLSQFGTSPVSETKRHVISMAVASP